MGIKATYNKNDILESFDQQISDFREDIIAQFISIGKRAVDIAVRDGNYKNRTGVLRSSIGCGVSFNGVLQYEYGFTSFPPEGSEGARIGRRFLREKLTSNVRRNTITLVVVAGAQHAEFVEKDFSVLRDGASFMERSVNSILVSLNVISNE